MIERIFILNFIMVAMLFAKNHNLLDQNITAGAFYDHLVLVDKENPMWYNDLEAPTTDQDRKKTLYNPKEKQNAALYDMGAYQVVIYSDRYLMIFKGGKLTYSLILRDNFGNIEFKKALDYTLEIGFDRMKITLKDYRSDTQCIWEQTASKMKICDLTKATRNCLMPPQNGQSERSSKKSAHGLPTNLPAAVAIISTPLPIVSCVLMS